MKFNPYYDVKSLLRYLFAFLALIVGMRFTNGAAFAVLIPIAYWNLSGKNPEKLMFIIFVSVLTLLGNPYFMPKGLIYAVSQRALMASLGGLMMVQIFGRKNSPLLTPLLWILPYLLFMACTSMKGWSPIISYLKLTLFTFVFFGIYASANRAIGSSMNASKFRSMYLAVMCVMIFGSVLVIPLGGIGYMGGDEVLKNPNLMSLFRGMTNHSQALGVFAAGLGVLIFADWLFSIQRFDKLYAALMFCIPILLYKSASRTAMGTFVGGCLFLFMIFMKTRNIRISWHSKVTQAFTASLVLMFLVVLAIPSVRDKVARFILKYGTEGRSKVTLNTEDILSSRQHKIDECLRNWHTSPTIGNGFQVSEDMKGFSAQSFTQILSAPVEKSTWIFAILEEGGVIGETLFVLYVLICVALLNKRKAYIGVTIFVIFIISNLGEFTIFSMSGGGGTYWTLVFIALILDSNRSRGGDVPSEVAMYSSLRQTEAIDFWERPPTDMIGRRNLR